jgi:hypothetical protein
MRQNPLYTHTAAKSATVHTGLDVSVCGRNRYGVGILVYVFLRRLNYDLSSTHQETSENGVDRDTRLGTREMWSREGALSLVRTTVRVIIWNYFTMALHRMTIDVHDSWTGDQCGGGSMGVCVGIVCFGSTFPKGESFSMRLR